MADVAKLTKKRLGEILREQGLITEEHIQEALDRQEETNELMGRTLINLGHVTEQDIASVLCTQFGLPYVDVENCRPNKDLMDKIPERFIKKYCFLPLDEIGDVVVIAVCGVFDQGFFDFLKDITNREIQLVISTRQKIKQALLNHLDLDPDKFDVDDTGEYIERDPEAKEFEESEESDSELIDLDQEDQQTSGEPEPVGADASDQEGEDPKTFNLDDDEGTEQVIDLESEAERIFEETENEIEEEEESTSSEQEEEGEQAPEEKTDEDTTSKEQQASISS